MLGSFLNNKKTTYVLFGLVFFVFILLPSVAQANDSDLPRTKDCHWKLEVAHNKTSSLNIDLSECVINNKDIHSISSDNCGYNSWICYGYAQC